MYLPARYGNEKPKVDARMNAQNKAQELGHAAKEKMNDAGRAVKNAAEKAGDKDKAGQKMHQGADAVKRH
ncbi:hypothetical protein GCK32_017318 [Trichostrongylus colubriformis]|uniref:Uncharacterized protein n=1 Tax=Trichostrongylus colubriformis TaxID=6319 RepID=A0AAN8FDG9_TRICO